MIKFLFSVYDRKAARFNDVFCVDDPMHAHRIIINMLNSDRSSIYYNFSGDFCLYCLYRFDTDGGLVLTEEESGALDIYSLEFNHAVNSLKKRDEDENTNKDI